MKVLITAIGKAARAAPEQALLAEYAKRLPWKLDVKECELKKTVAAEQKKTLETQLLLEASASAHRRVALDERGKLLSSEEFATTIGNWQQEGVSSLAFLIGGSDGLSDEGRASASLVLSFGRLTWPHMMVRAMLAEQLYRASTLLAGHPYHRA